ncbi:hypothetical protein [Marivita sp.]|uniref:hypothetical protein n=1 Tax=Marivita sp. TaxID=2003365 RepID=UPI002617A599|nr:hypothetical protein [Marivita sp.]
MAGNVQKNLCFFIRSAPEFLNGRTTMQTGEESDATSAAGFADIIFPQPCANDLVGIIWIGKRRWRESCSATIAVVYSQRDFRDIIGWFHGMAFLAHQKIRREKLQLIVPRNVFMFG